MADEDPFCLQVSVSGVGDGVKNFSKMLGCLDRFGKDLFFEFNDHEVCSPRHGGALGPPIADMALHRR